MVGILKEGLKRRLPWVQRGSFWMVSQDEMVEFDGDSYWQVVLWFPKKWGSAVYFEEIVAPVSLVLVLKCPAEVLVERLL